MLANTYTETAKLPTVLPMIGNSGKGRTYVGRRPVRLGDVNPNGRLRLDALTRYTQDVSNDDTSDAGLTDETGWVVRATNVDVISTARFGEKLEISTFCSGLGRRWAERRLSVTGSEGARYEVVTMWIHLDQKRGRPQVLTERFLEVYEQAADGRIVSARLEHGDPPQSAEVRSWPLRAVDYDLFEHVNNAAYWGVVEEFLAGKPASPLRARIEYGIGVGMLPSVDLAVEKADNQTRLWWLVNGKGVASASVGTLPEGLY